MNSRRHSGSQGRCIVLIFATMLNAAPVQAARDSDLAAAELKPVTRTDIHAALGADMAPAGQRLLALGGNTSSQVSAIVQQGDANQVSLTQSGGSNQIAAYQQGTSNSISANQQNQFNRLDVAQQGNGNAANFVQAGGARASVEQIGDAHRADVYQTSASPTIAIRQSGSGTVVQTSQY